MISRRDFIKVTAAFGGTLVASRYINGVRRVFAEPIAGGTLDPLSVTKYVTPMLIPPVMPKADKLNQKMGPNVDYYEISMKQFRSADFTGWLSGHPCLGIWSSFGG